MTKVIIIRQFEFAMSEEDKLIVTVFLDMPDISKSDVHT